MWAIDSGMNLGVRLQPQELPTVQKMEQLIAANFIVQTAFGPTEDRVTARLPTGTPVGMILRIFLNLELLLIVGEKI